MRNWIAHHKVALLAAPACLALAAAWLLVGPPRVEAQANARLELVFTYGSEKEEWVKDVTREFNARGLKLGGKTIQVTAIPLGSGECVDEVLDPDNPRRKAHL